MQKLFHRGTPHHTITQKLVFFLWNMRWYRTGVPVISINFHQHGDLEKELSYPEIVRNLLKLHYFLNLVSFYLFIIKNEGFWEFKEFVSCHSYQENVGVKYYITVNLLSKSCLFLAVNISKSQFISGCECPPPSEAVMRFSLWDLEIIKWSVSMILKVSTSVKFSVHYMWAVW